MEKQDRQAHHSSDLNALIQSLSSTLTNIDLEYRGELQRLQASRLTGEFRTLIARTLHARHVQRREPYVRHLAELRRRAAEITPVHSAKQVNCGSLGA